jgi:CopA family copper-resistance protein
MATLLALSSSVSAQSDTVVYRLTINQETVNKAGKKVTGMTVNGNIPGPTLRFTEGDYAVIYVENKMDVETSVHWHGLLLPNFYDGVPYLTTPPIRLREIQKYEFTLKQSGTYWYHSHTMLQEQSGVYGSIVIEPKEKTLKYDNDLVLVISDWTNQKPMNVLRNLKRGNEWYGIKKGTSTPLSMVIARGGLGAQLNFWRQRMEGADIADIYYPSFLINGEQSVAYPKFQAGEKVRLRIINGSASSQFWMTFGGEDPMLVAADGLNVVPVKHNKTFIAIAETYDFIVTIPEEGKIEFKAMAQDGSGYSTAYLGQGETLSAPVVERPDKIGMMMQMAKMDMRMGAPAMKFNPGKEEPQKMMNKWGMQMDGKMNMKGTDHSKMEYEKNPDMDMNGMDKEMSKADEKMSEINLADGKADLFSEYNYDYLKSPEKTVFADDKPVKDVLLNLTGNMWRYIWSMNGVPLSEADQIKIKDGEVTRITLNNLTMMHHPMHLHGHFFRVINENGDYSPLKHTVNVPPMQKVVIEFDGNEYGDWFFHCHVLYHMMSGMARIYSYDSIRDPRMKPFPLKELTEEGERFYTWGALDAASHMTELNVVSSNTYNQLNLTGEYGWNENFEFEVSYERYLYDYLSVFVGVNAENEIKNSYEKASTVGIAGIRFLTPYLFSLDARIDNQLRPEIRIGREIMVFRRTVVFGNYEYQMDFGWVNDLEKEDGKRTLDYISETTWSAGVEYFLSRNISIMVSYDNRFGLGGGLTSRF